MRKVSIFVEDNAHEKFIGALVAKVAKQHDAEVEIEFRSVRGGYGTVKNELKQYLVEILRHTESLPDLIIVATDANCQGLRKREKEIRGITGKIDLKTLCAIPDPHIERWFLIDSHAFKEAVGKGCDAPDKKCERSRYKKLLLDNILAAEIIPSFGGIEFAEDIVEHMDLSRAVRADQSFKHFISGLQSVFRSWR